MTRQHTTTWKRMGALACTIGAAAMLAMPSVALAEPTTEESGMKDVTGRSGTTEVTVKADDSNIVFQVPTVIAFSAGADGKLTGPTASETTIKNLSVFGIHVTNMLVEQESPWVLVADASSSNQENSIQFRVGPESNEKDAFEASRGGGIDLSAEEAWDMGFKGSGSDVIELTSEGAISHATQALSETGAKVATITWTVEPGQHVS